MALTNTDLDSLISSLSQEERDLLLQKLQSKQGTGSEENKPRSSSGKVYCCIYCGSTSYRRHGMTAKFLQRYRCNDCGRTFSENYGDSLRYTHLSDSDWKYILHG